jgi:hypothetical protein
MKLQPTATKVCHVKHWSSDTYDSYLSYHPGSSLPAKLQLHFQCSCCAMKLEHAWINNVPIIECKVHWNPWSMCAFFCRYPNGQVWPLQFFMSQFLTRCNQWLLWELPVVKIFPRLLFKPRMHKKFSVVTGVTCYASFALCCSTSWVRHCLGRQEGT